MPIRNPHLKRVAITAISPLVLADCALSGLIAGFRRGLFEISSVWPRRNLPTPALNREEADRHE